MMNPPIPRISIVVPVYGVEEYLADCLRSILIGDLADLEVIIVNDASPDSCAAIAADFVELDPRVRVITHPRNRGLSAARNTGLAAAKGTYVTFPDSDDLVEAGCYLRAVEALDSSGSDFACFPAEEFGGPRRRYWTTQGARFDVGGAKLTLTEAPEMIRDHTVWTKVFRRDFLLTEDIRWPEGVKCEDVVPSVRAYTKAKTFDVLPHPGYFYRRRPGSITTSLGTEGVLGDWITQTSAALAALREPGVPEDALKEYAAKALTFELASRLSSVEVAGAATVAAVRPLALDLAQICDAEVLLGMRPALRWKVAALLVGRPDLMPMIDDPDHRWPVQFDSLAAGTQLPSKLTDALGLGSLSFEDAFRARFIDCRPAQAIDVPPTAATAASEAPELSIIVPAHNVEIYIDDLLRCLRSVERVDFEVLVVNDASSDRTWELVQRHALADPRIRAIQSPGRGGGQARNCGVELARGEFLAFADGDDLVPPNAYATMLKQARDTDAEIVTGNYLLFSAMSTWDARWTHSYDMRLDAISLHQHPSLIAHRVCWNRIYRRDFWIASALPFPGVPRANDVVPVTSALTAAKRISVTPIPTYVYRARPGSSSMTARAGTAEATLAYLNEECLAAQLVNQTLDQQVIDAYWTAVLSNDCWRHVVRSVESWVAAEHTSSEAISTHLRLLLDLAPAAQYQQLDPERRAVFSLVVDGQYESAAALLPELRAGGVTDLSAAIDALSKASQDDTMDSAAISSLSAKYVLRPLLRQGVPDSSDLAERATSFISGLINTHHIQLNAVPLTREARLARALSSGSAVGVSHLLSTPASPVEGDLDHGVASTLVRGKANPLLAPGALLIARTKRGSTFVRICLGRVRFDSSGDWHVPLRTSTLPLEGRWEIYIEVVDAWGPTVVPLKLRLHTRLGHLGKLQDVRAMIAPDGYPRLFRRGPLLPWLARILRQRLHRGSQTATDIEPGAKP